MPAIEHWTLRHGTPATLRPIHAGDAFALDALICGLSPEDRRRRFHGAISGVTPERLQEMVAVDPGREVALVVLTGPSGRQALVADARYVVDATRRGAEFALMVAGAWQRQGIGERAVAALQRAAAAAGLRWLHGSVLADNAPMLALMRHCGFRCTRSRVDRHLVSVEAGMDPRQRFSAPPLTGSAQAVPFTRIALHV
ncbi:MAG: GNAT family N-acetyltransferase [Caldimonas sp.]